MAVARRGEGAARSLNAATFTRDELARVVEDVIDAGDPEAIRRLPGADPARGDILLAGALILEEVMDGFGLEEMIVSEYALREGVLLDTVRRRSGATAHLADIRRQGVLHLMELAVDDPDHAFQTAWLADELYCALAPSLEIDPGAEEILEAAALLANVGLWISHAGHHQHSYYVIRSSEHLTGFTDREIELIAQVARYHRKSAPSDRHPAYAALGSGDRKLVRALAAVLRIAIGLDRSHAELVQSVEVDTSDDEVVIRIGAPDPDVDLSLELWSANQRSDLLAEVLDRPVRIVAAGD
jgi:exopolyphosphatase/guanosine-5'-triphosphate,3'-diphosphate pyrophosphatase